MGPSYKLVILGDGTVQYEGYGGVFTRGRRVGKASYTAVSQLIEEFRKASFFDLGNYRSAATDLPVSITGFQVGSIRKEVVDYGLASADPGMPPGFASGAPEALVQLEKRIDEIANSRKWVKGSLARRVLRWH